MQNIILFRTDSHLTDEALRAAVADAESAILDDLARLEIAEHLSFCDNCLVRYTAMLTDETLLTPQNPVAAPVLQRIRHKVVRVLFNKYTTYAAAASFALVLWGVGVFNPMNTSGLFSRQPAQNPAKPPATAEMQKDESFLSGLNNALGNVFFKMNQSFFEKPATFYSTSF